jgi:hypothetical protein
LREDLHANTHESVPDSLQFTAAYKIGASASWKQKQDIIPVPAIRSEEAKQKFPDGTAQNQQILRKSPVSKAADTGILPGLIR